MWVVNRGRLWGLLGVAMPYKYAHRRPLLPVCVYNRLSQAERANLPHCAGVTCRLATECSFCNFVIDPTIVSEVERELAVAASASATSTGQAEAGD